MPPLSYFDAVESVSPRWTHTYPCWIRNVIWDDLVPSEDRVLERTRSVGGNYLTVGVKSWEEDAICHVVSDGHCHRNILVIFVSYTSDDRPIRDFRISCRPAVCIIIHRELFEGFPYTVLGVTTCHSKNYEQRWLLERSTGVLL